MPLAPGLRVILFEGEGARPLDSADRLAALTSLLERGFSVSSETNSASIQSGPAVVLGRSNGGPLRDQIRDISGLGGTQIADLVETVRAEAAAPKQGEWKPW